MSNGVLAGQFRSRQRNGRFATIKEFQKKLGPEGWFEVRFFFDAFFVANIPSQPL
jgi:hypothetical protein